MAEVSGIIGDQNVELNNAATESTLKQLLAAMTAMAKASGKDGKFQQDLEKELNRLAKEAAKNADQYKEDLATAKKIAKEEEDKLDRLRKEKKQKDDEAKAAAKAQAAKDKEKAAAENVANKLADVGKEIVGLMTGASKLIGTLGALDNSISKANAALASIPVVGGVISSILGPAADAAEKVYGSFTKLASVGATFGGSFNDMIGAATGVGLTLDQFNTVVAKNAQGLALFGGSTEAGAKKMVEIGKTLKNSEVGSELLRMGFTAEQVNDGMAAYIGTMSRTGALQGMTTGQVAAASGKYMKELDGLARLTGESREQKQKEMDELARDSQLNSAISHLSREEQEQARALIASYPKQHQAAIKDMIATGNITTEESIRFAAMMPQAAEKFMATGRTLEAGGKLSKKGMESTYDAYIDEAKVAKDRNKNLNRFSSEFRNEMGGITEAASRQKGAMSKIADEQGNLAGKSESSAEVLGKFQQKVAQQGNQFMNALQDAFISSGGLDALQKAFSALSNFAMDYVVPAMKFLFKGVGMVVDLFTGPVMTKITGWILALAPLAAAIASAVVAVKGLMLVGGTLSGIFSGLIATVAAVAWPVTLVAAGMLALYGIMKAFNIDFTQLSHLIGDTVMDAFQGVADFLEDIFVPAFDIVSDVLNDILIPAVNAAGDMIKAFYEDSIKPAYKTIKEFLNPALEMLGNFASKVAGVFSDITGKIAHFVRGFDSLGSITNYLADIFQEFSLFMKGMSLSLREKLSWLPGITAPSKDEKEALERERGELADKKRDAEIEREKVAQRRDAEAAAKQEQRDKDRKVRDDKIAAERKKRDEDYAKEKADGERKAADDKANEGKKGVDYSNPVAMYKSFKEQQSSTGTPTAGAGTTAGGGGATSTGVPAAALNQDQAKNMELIKAALQKQGITDPKYIAATMGNVMKETGGKSISENLNYGNTSNDRIRSIFGKRASGKTDKELDEIKKDPQQMGEMMYGAKTEMGQKMGNTEAGDGWKYRGRGFIQLTGKNNYAQASKAIYGDDRLVKNPDLVNDPAVAAEVSAWYMKKGQASMAKSMGIDTGNMTQEQANLLATSQVAGGDVRKKGSYLSGEVMDKVNKYSGQMASAAGAPVSDSAKATLAAGPSSTGTTVASADAARATAAATDPRRTDAGTTTAAAAQAAAQSAAKPGATNTAAAATVPVNPVDAMTQFITAGVQPATLAMQEFVAKGVKPFTEIESKRVEIAKAGEQKAKAEEDAKAAAEKARAEYANIDPRRIDAQEVAATPAPVQETAESLLSELNNKMDQLIKATNRTVDLNDKQLSVQRSMSGNLYA